LSLQKYLFAFSQKFFSAIPGFIVPDAGGTWPTNTTPGFEKKCRQSFSFLGAHASYGLE
jgi:hypothetical protein